MIETSLKTYLATLTSKNVYLLEKKQGDNDCVVFKRVGLPKCYRSHAGTLKFYKARFQIDTYGVNFANCRGLAETIIEDMDGNDGIAGVKLATLENDFYVKDIESGAYRNILEFFVFYSE